jgi:hypothetical protein
MPVALYLIAALLLLILALRLWRAADHRSERHLRERLLMEPAPQQTFSTALTSALPEPAQRYFAFTIAAGTPIRNAVSIDMAGEIGLGTRDAPGYRQMRATQLLVPPLGLVWEATAGPISGSDAISPEQSWTRFWLWDLIPVVRASGSDHLRSAFGRVIAEAAFWSPGSLLPGEHVRWEGIDRSSARAIVSYRGLTQAVDISVAESGAPTRVVIRRWSNANAQKIYREQPFGGDLDDFREFDGYRLPTRVEGGNLIGTPDYFPFFRARVTDIRFPPRGRS